MATGSFFTALNYRFWVKAGTTASAIPTSSTGLTEVLSLDNAGIQGQSETQNVVDYGSSQGFSAALVTSQSYSIPASMNLSLTDPGYLVLKDAALNATTKTVQWYRESPPPATGTAEKHAGVAFVSDFSEEITAGSVAKVTFTLLGYGAYSFTAQGTGTGTGT